METLKKPPLVSIGMPVYNGGDLLKLALDSLLAQEFCDFELNISDNASTDGTEQLCRDYASRDSRIQYIRRDQNYGSNNNGRHAFYRGTGKYYLMSSHDDQWHPRFLFECVKILESDPEIMLAVPAVQFLTPDLMPTDFPYPPLHTVGMGLRSRVAAIFNETNVGYNSYGLYRRQALLDMNVELDCYGGDVVMLMQLMFLGSVHFIPEKLFYYRLNGRTAKEQMESVCNSLSKDHPTKPYTILTINLMRTIVNANISPPLKRIILSDVLEIISLKNPDWRNVILSENPGIVRFVRSEENGLSPSAGENLLTAFSALLLPYCKQGDPYERVIDFKEIESFETIKAPDALPPSPGHSEFIQTLTKLLESNQLANALAYYDKHRSFQPDTENLTRIDPMIQRLKMANPMLRPG